MAALGINFDSQEMISFVESEPGYAIARIVSVTPQVEYRSQVSVGRMQERACRV